ncbi:beta-1,3-galactosyltransferase 5-like [Brachionichthys hirsutus]|uniref:beta-1,3-galactosyltransferase 5-like n=1 Tax=Brachionichthys hirsutus TaxID=412623 RepID=UPI0036051C04
MTDKGAGPWSAMKRCACPPPHQKKPLFYSLFQLLFLLCLLLCVLAYALTSGSLWGNFRLRHQDQSSFQWADHVGPDDPEPGVETGAPVNVTAKPIVPTTAAPNGTRYHEGYPQNYRFIIDHKDVCKASKPYLVLMVPVGTDNVRARDIIRQTWGNERLVRDKVVRTFFVLGLPGRSKDLQENLDQENLQHQDLIQSNFWDSYRNLTIKTMVMMHWLATRCPTAAYAMKVDSDMFLNVENLLIMLERPNIPNTNYLTGQILANRLVVRSRDSKWYVSEEAYPEPIYPPYPLGTAYLLSNDLPGKFVEISKSVKYFNIEDAYIGMCMKELGLEITPLPNRSQFRIYPMTYNRCEFSKLIVYNVRSSDELKMIWADLRRAEPPCPEKKPENTSEDEKKEG